MVVIDLPQLVDNAHWGYISLMTLFTKIIVTHCSIGNILIGDTFQPKIVHPTHTHEAITKSKLKLTQ